tara:strand:+ start:204 stop:1748 length:1545 start_codon:yes stop_codon:yes gene_type:complete
MQTFKKFSISFIILISFITFSQAETSWITKKKNKDKTEKVSKIIEKADSEWIKKKEQKEKKENKKKAKEKIKEAKSWITKKSKDKVKDIKNKLKKHKSIEDLPEAEFYFAAIIKDPEGIEDDQFFYGYINPNENSDKFQFKFNEYYELNEGIAYFEDKKNRCEVNVKHETANMTTVGMEVFARNMVLNCNKKLGIEAKFSSFNNTIGNFNGRATDGKKVVFEINKDKIDTIAKLENMKIGETEFAERQIPQKKKRKIFLKPNGKYYALLIGNSTYTNGWKNLISPVNDVRKIKQVLDKHYKFEKIILKENAKKKDIFQSLLQLSEITTVNDYVLIYYSGHGKTRAEQAYWIPTDGSLKWGFGDWINTHELTLFLRDEIKAHHLALLVDSCFVGGAFKGNFGVVFENLTEDEVALTTTRAENALNLRERVVVSSGDNNRVADNLGDTKYSRFAQTIISTLVAYNKKELPLNIGSLKFNMDLAYQNIVNQKPQMYNPPAWGISNGEFIFIPKNILR